MYRLISLFSLLSNRSGRSFFYLHNMNSPNSYLSLLLAFSLVHCDQVEVNSDAQTKGTSLSLPSLSCLQMDLIIVVVFFVVLYVSCSFTEHIISLSRLHLLRRERQQIFVTWF